MEGCLSTAEYPPCVIKNINKRKYLENLEQIDVEKLPQIKQPTLKSDLSKLLKAKKINSFYKA